MARGERSVVRWAALVAILAAGCSGGSGGGGGGGDGGGNVPDPLTPVEVRRAVGGGFQDGGLAGAYYASEDASGTPAFRRKDVRVDFDWGQRRAPGGSPSPGYREVPHDHFAVVWQGTLVPAFTETYTLAVDALDGARLSLRPAGGGGWTTVLDFLAGPGGNASGTYAFTAGQVYDVRLEYRHATGAARVTLLWSGPSFPREVIDPLAAVGLNNQYMDHAYADLVKGARGSFELHDYGVGFDAAGWPRGDCEYVLQESLNQGLDLSPLMRGTVAFRFKGRADGAFQGWQHDGVEVYGNVADGSVTYAYDAATQTTTGSFVAAERGSNATIIRFWGVHRTPGGPGGLTDLQLMRPDAVDSTTAFPFDGGPVFTSQYKDAYARFTTIRFQLVSDFERDWADRTPGTWFNQSEGRRNGPRFDPSYPGAALQPRASSTAYAAGREVTVVAGDGRAHVYYVNNDGTTAAAQPQYTQTVNGTKDGYQGQPNEFVQDGSILMIEQSNGNGPSWEHKVLLCNETGRDLLVSVPPLATDDYVRKLAQLLRYGSDGVNPYTSEQANPVFPPLNPNLRVHFEIGNELWNWGGVFWNDWRNIYNLVYLDKAANNADWALLDYDDQPKATRGDGTFENDFTWVKRKWVLRLKQHSDLFAEVWGRAALHRRVRPMFEWQYDNTYTADALQFLEDWFDNGDGLPHVADPQPPSAFLWGGGGATYYGATDPDGLTAVIDGAFGTPALGAGYHPAPAGAAWSWAGAAGLARPAAGGADPSIGTAAGDDVPQAPTTRGERQPGTAYALGDTVYLTAADGLRHLYRCTGAGTSGTWGAWGNDVNPFGGAAGETVQEGTARWTEYTGQVAWVQGGGSMSYAFAVPAFQSPYFAISFKAQQRRHADGTVDQQRLQVFLDGEDVTARTFSGGATYAPRPYGDWQAGPEWGANNVAWTSSHYFSTRTFAAQQAGEAHVVEIRGAGGDGDVAFVADVRLASVDALFAAGVPGGGGQAAGQPAAGYQRTLRTETRWARIYGLQPAAYEGGWSIGGDDGGTMLQNQAKMGGGAQTAAAQREALDRWRRAGGDLNTLGTYAQWPSYSDYYAVEGLLDPGAWPLMQGTQAVLDSLPPAPSAPEDGLPLGTALTWENADADLGSQYHEDLRGRSAWTGWTVVVPASGTYPVTLGNLRPTSAGDATPIAAAVIIDGATVLTATAAGDASAQVFLTAGLHGVRLQSKAAGHIQYDAVQVGP